MEINMCRQNIHIFYSKYFTYGHSDRKTEGGNGIFDRNIIIDYTYFWAQPDIYANKYININTINILRDNSMLAINCTLLDKIKNKGLRTIKRIRNRE